MIRFTDPTTGKRIEAHFGARWPGDNRGAFHDLKKRLAELEQEPQPTMKEIAIPMELNPEKLPSPEEAIEAFRLTGDFENDPMLLFSGTKGMTVVVLNGFGPGQMGPVIERMLPKLVEEQGEAHWVVLCAEAWAKSFPKEQQMRPGILQEMHEAGDDTVREVVMANGFSKDREYSAQQEFSRKDGEIVWGELEVMDESVQLAGGIPDAIRPIFT